MRRILGLDLNGWRDAASRDWSPDEPNVRLDSPINLDGGHHGSAVKLLDGSWVGGPQAALAPHGRGPGWGEVGASCRRVRLASSIAQVQTGKGNGTSNQAVAAIVNALARSAQDIVLTVPDLPTFDEAAQGRFLALLKRSDRSLRLLWRPVALFLDALNHGAIDRNDTDRRYRLLIHTSEGVEQQILKLRRDGENEGHVAPERDGYGTLLPSLPGLSTMTERAQDLISSENPRIDWRRCDTSNLAPAILSGASAAGDVEILRYWNDTWVEVIAPDIAPNVILPDDPVPADPDRDVAATFLATPLAPRYAEHLMATLFRRFGEIRFLSWEGIAHGAVLAGRLIEKGLPHYFDRLEPIALAVLRGDEPAFQDLVPQQATLPANREFVSDALEAFKWRRGKTANDFYVLKGATEVRHWEVQKEGSPSEDVPVTLRLRQTPGQSWAKLTVTSRDWEPLARTPITLDWEKLSPVGMSPEEVLETLRRPAPTIPERIVELPHIDLWRSGPWVDQGLNDTLDAAALRGDDAQPESVVWHLRRSRRHPDTRDRYWIIGTDGTFPTELSRSEHHRFVNLMNTYAERIVHATLEDPPSDNDTIACLTWTFTLCPESVQERIVEALEARLAGRRHPLLEPPYSISVVTQGAGRAITGVERIRRVFEFIRARPANNNTINALAMLLTRREEAPRALDHELVAAYLEMLGVQLRHQVKRRSFKVVFRNTLSALGGLFRWREVEPYALLAARDPQAAQARSALVEAKIAMTHLTHITQLDTKLSNIDKIIKHFDGEGDPNILSMLEDDDDDEPLD